MPLATFLGVTEMEEVIETELVPGVIDEFEYGPRVGTLVAGIFQGKGNIPKRFARWNQLTIPGGALGIAETVDAPDANVDITESSITPARIRFRLPISDEVGVEAEAGIPMGALATGLEALMDQLNSDVLGSSTAATNTVNSVTDVFELDEFRAMRQAYRVLELSKFGVPALVLEDDALDPLETAIDSSASPYLLKASDTLQRELGPSYQGTLRGFEVFRDPAVATEGAGHSNFATPMGPQGGLGIVMNKMPSVEMTRGDTAVNRGARFYHFELWKGQGIRNPRRFLEVLST